MNEPARPLPPLRQQLQQALNDNQIEIAKRGLAGIDKMKEKTLKQAAERGIVGVEEIVETGANFIKAILVRSLSK